MALFCPMGTGRNLFTLHKTGGLKFFHRRKSKRVQGSEDSHSQSSSQASETHEEGEKCEKLDYVMKWNASVIKGLEKSTSLESFCNSSVSRSSNRDSLSHSISSESRTSLDSLSKSDENLANWKGPKVYNSVRKTHSMENLKQSGKGITKPELESLLSGISCGKNSSVRVKLLWNFEPMSDRELRVYKGEVVQVLYKQKDWLYALKSDGKQGYIPYNYCTVVRKSDLSNEVKFNGVTFNGKKDLAQNKDFNDGFFTLLRSCSAESVMEKYSQEKHSDESLNENSETKLLIPKRVKANRLNPTQTVYSCAPNSDVTCDKTRRSSLQRSRNFPLEKHRKSSADDLKDKQFRKVKCDMVRVMYDYNALDENDLSVKRNELLQVLNKEDKDWWWVRKENGSEGFVPYNYVQSVNMRASKGARKVRNRASVGLNQVKFQEHVVVHCYEILSDEDNDEEDEVDAEAIDVTDMRNSDCSTWC